MPRQFISHSECDHGDSKRERRECRTQRQHADCDHGSTPQERNLCTRARRQDAKEAGK